MSTSGECDGVQWGGGGVEDIVTQVGDIISVLGVFSALKSNDVCIREISLYVRKTSECIRGCSVY